MTGWQESAKNKAMRSKTPFDPVASFAHSRARVVIGALYSASTRPQPATMQGTPRKVDARNGHDEAIFGRIISGRCPLGSCLMPEFAERRSLDNPPTLLHLEAGSTGHEEVACGAKRVAGHCVGWRKRLRSAATWLDMADLYVEWVRPSGWVLPDSILVAPQGGGEAS
jgi:hypothetical protein